MEIQPLGCCFNGCLLRLRLLVASVPSSPANGRDGEFPPLELVVRCSSTSGAEIVLASWNPLLVSSSLYSPATGKPLCLQLFEVMDLVFFLPLLGAPSLEAPQRGPACFCGWLLSLWPLVCRLSSPPLGVEDGVVSVPLMLCASTGNFFPWPLLDFPCCGFSAGLCRSCLASTSRCLSEYALVLSPAGFSSLWLCLVERI